MKKLILVCGAMMSLVLARGDDFQVKVTKGQRFSQTGPSSPIAAANPFYFEAGVGGVAAFEPVTNPQVTLPNGSIKPATPTGEGRYGVTQSFANQAALDSAFPAGRYGFSATVNLIGLVKGHANLSATIYPPVPQALNFTEAQSIDPTAEFTLRWNEFAGAGANDLISLIISDAASGATITSITDLDPSISDWTFNADELVKNANFQAKLTFFKKSDPGLPDNGELLTGIAVSISETVFSMKTAGDSTATDTTPPALTTVTPTSGALMANPFDIVLFQFDEAMDTTRTGVQWQATLNGQRFALDLSKFTYIWGDPKSLICSYRTTAISGWPPGLTIVWKLNQQPGAAGNLRDAAGNELPSQSGTFVTAGGLDPCSSSSSGALPQSAFFFSKQVNYLQTSSDTPVEDPDKGAQAFAFCDLESSAFDLDVVTLKVPTSNPFQFKLKALSVINGATNLHIRLLSENFTARSDLDDSYPAGVYQMELRNSQVVVINSAALNVTATGYPPPPHFSNFSSAQSVNGDTDFTLPWDAFKGATTNTENVTLNIYDSSDNLVFQAPNECREIKLSPDAGGILIPGKTLQNGQSYTAELSFARLSDRDKTLGSLSGFGFASLTRITRMPIKTSGGAVTPPKFSGFSYAKETGLQTTITCTPGHVLVLEQAVGAGFLFSPILTTNPPNATILLTMPLSSASGIIRAKNL